MAPPDEPRHAPNSRPAQAGDRERPGAAEERTRFSRGLPDHHDPTSGVGGAPPARSALTLRIVLATFGLVVCTAGALWTGATGMPVGFVVVFGLLAVVAAVDLVVVIRRKARGEPG